MRPLYAVAFLVNKRKQPVHEIAYVNQSQQASKQTSGTKNHPALVLCDNLSGDQLPSFPPTGRLRLGVDAHLYMYSGLDNSVSLSGETLLFHTLVWDCYSNWD